MAIATLVLVAWVLAATLMLGLWLWHLRIGNVGVVDAGWALSVPLIATLHAAAGDGYAPRRFVIAGMFLLWGSRLGIYLLRDRVLGQPEDGRYADLRARGSIAATLRFFPFFQVQALAAVVLATPALIASFNGTPGLATLEIAAIALWSAALIGETVADRQLERFKARQHTGGRTCREGLWRFSRHPNYFFEWLVWVAYALFALASPWGVIALACPVLMLYLLFRVTGIPATEAQALRTRGDDYRQYQATTSVFVPWFPRSAS